MAKLQTLAGEWFEPDLPGRLLKIAGDIREATCRKMRWCRFSRSTAALI